MKTVRAIIKGRVQGVSYRAWTVRKASAEGINGWVRNLSDGSVEAVFSGASEKVDAMLVACRQGPAAARVDAIDMFKAEAPAEHNFTAKPTL